MGRCIATPNPFTPPSSVSRATGAVNGTRGELCSSAAAHAFAVTSDPISAIGVHEIAPRAAGDHVARAVAGVHDVAPGAGEEPVASRAAVENVVARKAVQHVVAGKAAKDVA